MGNAYRSVLALKPTGDAVPANVLAGKTFSNADGTGKTGTMVNNGAVSITLTDQDPTYTIPEGYHNGSGVVGFSASGGDGADLIVTCSSVFAGATISCTDGTTTYQKICPSSSPFEVVFESIPVGTWTISGSYSGTTFTTIFTVLDFEAALNAIPEGSTVTPTDDIQTWLHCANIWDKTYTTISQILSDASTLQALIASNNAADYMARSTTWASNVTADSSSMTYIGLNDYCSEALLANSTWRNAICDSSYFESVLNVCVPAMTSATTPSGSVYSSVTPSTGEAWQVFNRSTYLTAAVAFNSSSGNPIIGYEFAEPLKIYKVGYAGSGVNTANNHYTAMTAQINGNNGSESIKLFDISKTKGELQSAFRNFIYFNINPNTAYKKYEFQFIGSNYDYMSQRIFGGLQFYGRA